MNTLEASDPKNLKDWVVQGANPDFKRKVEALREANVIATEDADTMGELYEGVLQDAIQDARDTVAALKSTGKEDTETGIVADNMRQELLKVIFLTSYSLFSSERISLICTTHYAKKTKTFDVALRLAGSRTSPSSGGTRSVPPRRDQGSITARGTPKTCSSSHSVVSQTSI
jgi:hypothetical protein